MKTYMIHTYSHSYCVFSETVMNSCNNDTTEEALADFYTGRTFDPTRTENSRYHLNPECTKVFITRNGELFGNVLYEIPSPTDTSTYEYW